MRLKEWACEWFPLSIKCSTDPDKQNSRTSCIATSPEDSFLWRLTWNVGHQIGPFGMRRFYVARLVVARTFEHRSKRQSITAKAVCMLHLFCVPRSLQSLIPQIITVPKTVKQRRLLHFKYLSLLNTIYYFSLQAQKCLHQEENCTAEQKIYRCPPRFRIYLAKSQNAPSHSRSARLDSCFNYHAGGVNYKEDWKVTGHHSRPDLRCLGTRASRVHFENHSCGRNTPSPLLGAMLSLRPPSLVTAVTHRRLSKHSTSPFLPQLLAKVQFQCSSDDSRETSLSCFNFHACPQVL